MTCNHDPGPRAHDDVVRCDKCLAEIEPVQCPYCTDGYIDDDGDPCETCNGSGYARWRTKE